MADPFPAVANHFYDRRDWESSVTDAAGRETTLVHKANGAVQQALRPGSRNSTFGTDGDQRVTSTVDPGANTGSRSRGFSYTTNSGLPRDVFTDSDGLEQVSDFDRLGRLRFLRDKRNATFEFRYDALGRRTHVITPTAQTEVSTYKNNGRPDLETEPSGDTTKMGYYPTSGRLQSATFAKSDGATSIVNYTSYDDNGNVLALNQGGTGNITRTYDRRGRVSSYTGPNGTIGYRYYPSGKLAKLIYPGGNEASFGHVEYTYWPDGRLKDVIDRLGGGTRTTTYAWRTDGRLQSITRPNGTVRTIGYDAAGRPDSISEQAGATALLNYVIGYYLSDDIKFLTVTPSIPAAQLATVSSAAMTHDAANQVSTFNGTSTLHDADGNMTFGPLPNTGAMGAYAYNSRNWLTSAGGLSYTYDAEGNRIGISGAETQSFVVDPEGALPKVLLRIKNGITTRYVYGAGLLYEVNSSGVPTYYHHDQTGNTAALTNSSGSVVERVAYSPYGSIRYRQSNFDTPFLYGGFFGVMTDSNGLINMRARYYNPLTMRFINSDPARDGLNWYTYANGNPINLNDPTGLGAKAVVAAYNTGLRYLGMAASASVDLGVNILPIGKNNQKFLADWTTGRLPSQITYAPDSPQTMDMRKSRAADVMRGQFAAASQQNVRVNYSTSQAFIDTIANPFTNNLASTAMQVGGFGGATVKSNGDGTATFKIVNVAGAKSFFYHAVPNRTNPTGPMHNVTQTFIWTESINQ